MEKIKDYFKRYPNNDEVFENGSKLFHTRGAADSFGKSETKRYTRGEAEKEKALGGPATGEQKEAVILKIKETEDFTSIPYDQLKVWAKIIELKTADNKKETLLKAFADFKETLKDK
jgi:hypothetical protein